MPKNEQALLTTAETAERLEVSTATVNRWVRLGQLTPAVQAPGIRGPRFFRPEQVEAIKAGEADR